MRLIDRKLQRDLWSIKGRVLSLVLIIASGVGILFGIQTALSNLISTQEALFDQMNFADLEVQLLPEDVLNLPQLEAIPGVARIESRLIFPGTISLGDEDTLAGLVLFQESPHPKINRLSLLRGRSFSPGSNEVVIDKALAEYHGYEVGQEIEVKVGRKMYTFSIAGIAMSPEFLITSSNPDYVIAEPGSLGVVWADIQQVTGALGFTMVNSLLFDFSTEGDQESAKNAVLKALERAHIERVTPANESYSYKSVRMDVTAFRVYSPAIIATLCALSIAMGIITFRRFAVEKQQEFGVLAALGFRRRRVCVALLKVGSKIGLVGGGVGLLLGWLLGWAFAEVYAQAMHLPVVVHTFNPGLAFLGLALGFAAGALSLMISMLPMLGRSPRQLLVPTATRSYSKEKLNAMVFPLTVRLGLRSIAREKLVTASAIFAMGGAVAVAISYGLAMTSTFGTVEQSFNQEKWMFAIDFQYPLYGDEAEELLDHPEVDATEPYYRTAAEIRNGELQSYALLIGQALPSSLRKLDPELGRSIENEGEAVLSMDLARELNLQLNSSFTIEKGSITESAKVVGITNDIFLQTVNLALPTVQKLSEAGTKVTGYYVSASQEFETAMTSGHDEVARITDKSRLVSHFRTEIENMMGIVYITIVFSVAVSLLFVSTIVHLSIAEKVGEFAVLRSLGFSALRLRTMMFTAVGAQVMIAVALAIPLSLALVQFLNQRMGEAWFAVHIHANPSDFMLPMLAALLVAPIVGSLGARAILKVDIPTHMRGRSI